MNKDVEDIILKKALTEAETILLKSLSSQEKIKDKYTFSKEFLEKIDKLIKYEKRKTRIEKISKNGKKIATIILLLLVISLVTTLSVEALRVKIFNIILEIYEKGTDIKHEKTGEYIEKLSGEDILYEPTYIPEEFELEKKEINIFGLKHYYINEERRRIIFEQYLLEHREMTIDTEGVELKEININGYEGYYYSNKGNNNILLNDAYYGFWLSSTIDMDELIKIAESIEKKEDK